jgi:hypothetical protein
VTETDTHTPVEHQTESCFGDKQSSDVETVPAEKNDNEDQWSKTDENEIMSGIQTPCSLLKTS